MGNPKEAPELFSDSENVIPKWGEELVRVPKIPITPDGAYNGNGEYKVQAGTIFKITGFDKRGKERWFGAGKTPKTKPSFRGL